MNKETLKRLFEVAADHAHEFQDEVEAIEKTSDSMVEKWPAFMKLLDDAFEKARPYLASKEAPRTEEGAKAVGRLSFIVWTLNEWASNGKRIAYTSWIEGDEQ